MNYGAAAQIFYRFYGTKSEKNYNKCPAKIGTPGKLIVTNSEQNTITR